MKRREFLKYSALACLGMGLTSGCSHVTLLPKENVVGELMETKDALLYAIQFHLAEHCNLNCKYCCHFSCIAEEEVLDIKKFESDIKRLAELTDSKIFLINLLGGEPLLNKNICEFMKISRKYFPNTHLSVNTNGILLDVMPDDFWKTLHDYYFGLHVSYYPTNLNWDDIVQKTKDFDVMFDYVKIDEFSQMNLILDGSNDYAETWTKCTYKNRCAFVQDGKYYTCYIPACIRHFNKKFNKNLEVSDKDYLDIYKAKSFNDFIEYSVTPIPFCRYCGDFPYTFKWENSDEHDITEWTCTSDINS